MRATPVSAVSFVTRSFATVFRAATNDGSFDHKLGSLSRKLVEILKMSKNFFMFFVMKSNFFCFYVLIRQICLDGTSDPGLTNACTIFFLSSKKMESSINENPKSSSDRYQKCRFSFIRAASDTWSPDANNCRTSSKSFFGAEIPRGEETSF